MKKLVVGIGASITLEQSKRLQEILEDELDGMPVVVIGGCASLQLVDTPEPKR